MAGHVELSKVRIGYDERGRGEPLVVLHGGVVDARFFDPNIEQFAARFQVFTPDLRGHGRTADVDGPFTYDALAQDIIEFVDTVVGGPVHLAGHSVGAGVALHVVRSRPDLVRRLVLISAVFHHEGLIATGDTDVDQVVGAFGASYGQVSPDGEAHFPVLVKKVVELDEREPVIAASELGNVTARTLIIAADDDLIALEHTVALYRGIPDSELAVVPGTSHFLTQEKPELFASIVVDFLANDPVPTVAPMRRA
jgi:pimeloyl-ACP methyl ester carboxylesterase